MSTNDPPHAGLTPGLADLLATIALGHVTREYPHKLDHILDTPGGPVTPSELHPIFHGSFDWHSCVHGYWLLLHVRRRFPHLNASRRIEALADDMFTPEKVAGELAYLDRPASEGFERPYGWAWLLALHREACWHVDRRWGDVIEPLARAFAGRFRRYLPRLSYPIRSGSHGNTAFALLLALHWADPLDPELATLIRARAIDYFGMDRDVFPSEPGGDDFLSPALIEALCMRHVLGADAFARWLETFLPRLAEGMPRTIFTPAFVSDRADGKIVHLDGLNLSRSWCWRELARTAEPDFATRANAAAAAHLEASLPFISSDYAGEHWLATFALLGLDGLD